MIKMMMDKNWFKNYQKLETTVYNPDVGKTEIDGKGDVDVEARDNKGVLHKLTSGKILHVPEYKIILISVSHLFHNQHELFHTKAKSFLKTQKQRKPETYKKKQIVLLNVQKKEDKHHLFELK